MGCAALPSVVPPITETAIKVIKQERVLNLP